MASVFSTVHYESSLMTIGTFHCPASHPAFPNSGSIDGSSIVFPRTSVCITHAGRRPVVADPNVVMFYNKGQEYTRSKLSEKGDLCDWFGFSQQVVVDVMRSLDPDVAERRQTPFIYTHGPAPSRIYLQQRMVVQHLNQANSPDHLFIEETVLSTLAQVIENAYRVRQNGKSRQPATRRAHADLVQDAKKVLVTHFREGLTLAEIAAKVYTSPYHLSRVFRQQTGVTIHNYLHQVRLRTALEHVAQGDSNLAYLGLDLGYASHSHFTQAFRRTFGVSPSSFRKTASQRRLREMSKILTA